MKLKRLFLLTLIGFYSGCGMGPPYNASDQEKLARETPDFKEIMARFEGHTIYGVRTGKDHGLPAILFIHGSPGSWDAWGRYLADHDLREKTVLIAFDRPGFGKSDEGTPERSVKAQSDRLLTAALTVHPGPFILVGHSYGGPVATQMAIDHPDQVASMILLAGSLDPSLEKEKFIQKVGKSPLIRWMVPEALDMANQEILPLKGELEKQTPYLSKIEMPVTVIQGMKDDLVPPGNADYIESHFTSAKLNIIRLPQQNHFLPWREYDLVKDRILNALDRNKTAP